MTKKYKLTIDKERCKGCMLCIKACPQGALVASEGVNGKGSKYVVMGKTDKCTGCGLCFMMCPDCGIEITEIEE